LSWKENFTPFGLGSVGNVDAIMTGKITAKGKRTHS
jgi:putative sterol carrier protein